MHPVYPSILNDSFRNEWTRLLHLQSLGFKPKSILDIGAHHGGWSILAQSIWPEASILSVEANEACREKLSQHVRAFEIATLSDTEESVTYWKCADANDEGNSLFRENTTHPFVATSVQTKKLSTLVGERTFDLIKIDCQGAELKIISGGEEIIKHAHAVQLETQIQEYNEGAPAMAEVISKMSSLGFRVFDITDLHYNKTGMLLQIDILFIQKESDLFTIRPLN